MRLRGVAVVGVDEALESVPSVTRSSGVGGPNHVLGRPCRSSLVGNIPKRTLLPPKRSTVRERETDLNLGVPQA